MEPYKRLLDRRWDDLSARIGQLEEELEDTKKRAEEARAKGGRVETEIIVTVRLKKPFLFMFIDLVLTTLEEFKNAALFLRLGHRPLTMVRPTVHTHPSRKRSFSKTLFKPEELKTPALSLRVDDSVTIIGSSPCSSFFQAQSKMAGD